MPATDISVKPLVDGERMSREEFIGRWELLPEVKLAELIRGVVYMPSPVSRPHGWTDGDAGYWLNQYAYNTPGCRVLHNATWLMRDDVPQPDVALCILPEYSGQSGVRGRLATGAPELAVEVSLSSEKLDRGDKKDLYEQAGVLEYILLLADSRMVWYTLIDGRYRESQPGADGIFRSTVFPGLWLDPAALFAGDGRRIMEVVNLGLATPEHAAFVAKLEQQRAGRKRR